MDELKTKIIVTIFLAIVTLGGLYFFLTSPTWNLQRMNLLLFGVTIMAIVGFNILNIKMTLSFYKMQKKDGVI